MNAAMAYKLRSTLDELEFQTRRLHPELASPAVLAGMLSSMVTLIQCQRDLIDIIDPPRGETE